MITRRMFAIGAAGIAIVPGTGPLHAAPAALSSLARVRESAALRKFSEATHPRGLEASVDRDWRTRWQDIESGSVGLSDGHYFVSLRRALGWFKDGHTTVLPFDIVEGVPQPLSGGPFGYMLPWQVRAFHDGARVVRVYGAPGELLGARIERIGRLSAAELVRTAAQDWPGNDAWAHRWGGAPFASPALLQALGAIDNAAAPVTVVLNSGGLERTVEIAPTTKAVPGTPATRTRSEREKWAEAAGSGNYLRMLNAHRAIYLSIDAMDDVKGKSFEALTKDLFAALPNTAIDRLIVDLRRNGGGNNYLGEAMRKGIAASRFNAPGRLFVLISPNTFSAAQNLANRLERETFAIFIGEPTGGAPNHYGDAKIFKGEATGITAIVSTIPWFDSYPQDQRPWIMPDVPIPNLFSDWQAGRDPVLDAALRQSGPPMTHLHRDRIFYFERTSQKLPWAPFWR